MAKPAPAENMNELMTFRQFQKRLIQVSKKPNKSRIYLLFFNIENFKLVNSTLSPQAGDHLLSYTGSIIHEQFPKDSACRIGEDHFAVLTTADNITDRIILIHDKVRAFYSNLQMQIKTGIYEIHPPESHPLVMLDRARLACLSCRGRFDRVYAFYNPRLSESLITHKYIVAHISSAIENQYIHVYYQPLIRILSGRLCGLEALARWEDPEYGLLSPADFISVLEDAHLIHRLDLHMAECVCRDIRRMMDEGETVVPVSINLSRLDFDLCDMFTSIDEIVHRHNLTPDLLDIEITESALSEADDSLKNTLKKFRENGYRIWMDDFGSRYSSLNTLKDYDFDVMKIDMAFLRGFDDEFRSEKTKTIVRSVINMARELGIQTLCEGVETKEQLSFLRDSGCEIAQGYLFSKPLPIRHFYEVPYIAETNAERIFADKAGRVSLFSNNPLGHETVPGMDAGLQPMALFSYYDSELKLLAMNSSFKGFLNMLGIQDGEHLNQRLSTRSTQLVERLCRLADRCIDSHTAEYADMVLNGDYCNIQVYAAATNPESGRTIFLVRALDVTRMSNYVTGGIKDKVLRSVYSLFERIDILDIPNDAFLNVFEGRGKFRGSYRDLPLQTALNEICEANIHPDDWDRFKKLYNMKTLPDFLRSLNVSFHTDMFRLRESEDTYSWQPLIQTLVMLDGREVVLSLVGNGTGFLTPDSMSGIYEQIEPAAADQNAFTAAELFEALIHHTPYGIFWKDENRRFLGANRFFLDFYGFLSDKDIIGKTDEDMNWHMDPVPFMRNEEYVLQGHSVYNSEGSCIARGQDHRIEASKFPIQRNGKVIGLIGYFKDLGINAPETEEGLTDDLTGLLNARGAIAAFSRYKKIWIENGTDFSIMSVDVNDFGSLNHRIGVINANEVLRKIGEILVATLGDASVIARISGDEFLILRQINEASDLVRDEYGIASAVSSIRSVNGVPVTVSVTVESIVYSKYRYSQNGEPVSL